MFLNKVFILAINKKAFRLEGYVICFVSVYTTGAPNENIVQNHLNIALLNVF